MATRSELTNAEKMRRLPWQVAGGASNAVFCMLTVFGSVFMVFMSELGLAKTQIGILLSLFPFCGLLALVVAPAVERAGLKKTYLTFWGIRKIVMAGLIAAPVILDRFGKEAAFFYVATILLVFAVCRSISETAFYAWQQELVPDSVRGKFGAVSGLIATACTIVALAFAGRIIAGGEGLARFQVVFAVGLFFGFVSVWTAFFWPGGGPIDRDTSARGQAGRMLQVLRDRNFLTFLTGIGLVTLASGPLYQFFYLYMREEVGLARGQVVWIEMGFYTGMMVTGYLWGWAADRFGAKPVMICAVGILAFLPILMSAISKDAPQAIPGAVAVASLWGVASAGWGLGLFRHLYVSVMPADRKTQYTAVFYAWIGVIGGCGPLLAGAALDALEGLHGSWWVFTISQYTPVFLTGSGVLVVAAVLVGLLKAEGQMPAGEFVAMFFQGSPLRAVRSSMRWYFAREEHERISTTESFSEARSPLNVEELLEALADPSFNVRYEAVVSISRTRANDRLVDALIEVLRGDETDLGAAAAWALSRLGAERAVPALRETLESPYPVLRAGSARALAMLGDRRAAPLILQRFRGESEEGVRIAFASALGALRASEATGDLLSYLAGAAGEVIRQELVLALARMLGVEGYYVRLWRSARNDPGTAVSRAIGAVRKGLSRSGIADPALIDELARSEEALAGEDLGSGCASLKKAVEAVPTGVFRSPIDVVLRDCARHLGEFGDSRPEYVLLTVAAFRAGLNAVLRERRGKSHQA